MNRIFLSFLLILTSAYAQHLVSETGVGGVTSNSARFRVNLSAAASVKVMLSQSKDFSNPVYSSSFNTDPAQDNSVILEIQSLNPSTKYYYSILVNGTAADTKIRTFTTFPDPGSNNVLTFAFGSCQQSNSAAKGEIFKEVVKQNPGLFLQIGDWTYPDTTEKLPSDLDFFPLQYERVLENYRSKFSMHYGMDTLLKSVPVSYAYDDHDFMNNNSSATSVSYVGTANGILDISEIPVPASARENAINGFLKNMPDYDVENPSRGIYRKFRYGSAEIFVLDLRSQRTPDFNCIIKNNAGKWEFINPENHTIMGNSLSPGNGEDQFTWLKRSLAASSAKWKFIVSSVPFNRGQIESLNLGIAMQDSLIPIPNTQSSVPGIGLVIELSDKWVGYFEELESLLDYIRQNNISNVFVLSGDSHTAAMDDGNSSGLPEIMSANLDIGNSRTAAALFWLGADIWNKGIQGVTTPSTYNTFGFIKIFGSDSVSFNVIDETGDRLMQMTMFDQALLPAVTNLSVTQNDNKVKIKWNIPTETNIKNFEIQSSADGITFRQTGIVNVMGMDYELNDNFEVRYRFYRIKINGVNGSFRFSETVKAAGSFSASDYVLYQNYPNPFNGTTKIKFTLPQESQVTLKIYDILGQSKTILSNEPMSIGTHEVEFKAEGFSSGTYIYSIKAGNFSAIRKMIILK